MIYDTIKEVCKEKGVSIASVEKKANLSNGTISKWNKSSPTVDKLQAVAVVLKVKIEKLLKEEEYDTAIQTALHSTRGRRNPYGK